jgi:uncharacterized RDD family membrane protein YckC
MIIAIVGSTIAVATGFGQTGGPTSANGVTTGFVFVDGTVADLAFALTSAVYFGAFWTGGRRATIGQRILDIQVGNAFDGRPLSIGQAGRRWLALGPVIGIAAPIPGLGPWVAVAQLGWALVLVTTTAVHPTRQGLHDRFAGSAVVRPANRGTGAPALACLVLVAIGLLLLVAIVAALIYLGSQLAPSNPGTVV